MTKKREKKEKTSDFLMELARLAFPEIEKGTYIYPDKEEILYGLTRRIKNLEGDIKEWQGRHTFSVEACDSLLGLISRAKI